MKINAAAFNAKILQYRHTGTHGTPISMHRALRHITLNYSALFAIIALPVFFTALLWSNLESITGLWAGIFDFWIDKLQLNGSVAYADTAFLGKQLSIPYPDLPTTIPSQTAIVVNIVASLLMLALANFIPKKYLPVTYVLRAALLIQISASFYFILKPESRLYELASYIPGMLTLGLYLLLLVAPLLAMIYYIFDFAFWRKLAVTTVMVGYFVVALPFQYLFHALIISSGSLLFMPVLYLLFGALLNTFMFVSCYALAMTWRARAVRPLYRDSALTMANPA